MIRSMISTVWEYIVIAKPYLFVGGVILSVFFLMTMVAGCRAVQHRDELFSLDPDTVVDRVFVDGAEVVKVRIPTALLKHKAGKSVSFSPLEKYCCFIVGPDRVFVQRLCPVHQGEGKVLEILRAETLETIKYYRGKGEPPGSYCWIYNEELNIGASIPDVQGERLVFAKVIAAVRIPKDLHTKITQKTLRMDK